MESVRVAVNIVLPIFIMIAVGYVIKCSGLMNEASIKQINKVVFKIFLPLLVFKNVYSTSLEISFDSDLLIFAALAVLVEFFLALFIALAAEKENYRRGVMLQGMFRSNFVLFGIPVCSALFGESASSVASILIAVIIPMYNLLAVVALETFNGKKPNIGRTLLGIIKNPLIIACATAAVLLFFNIELPDFLYSAVNSLSNIATPLAFVILGASFNFKDIGDCIKDLSITLIIKLIIFPLFFLGIAIMFGFRDTSLAVLLSVFASPIAVSSFTMAQQMGGDDKLAGQLVVFSSILSVVTLFLFISLLKQLAFL